MGLIFRKRVRVPGGYLNASRSGVSFTFKLGPLSRNSRAGIWRLNLPGPFSWTFGKRRRVR